MARSTREESFHKRIQAECEYSRGRESEGAPRVIGSVWTTPNDNRYVPYLDNWNDKRKLNLNDWRNEWNRNYQFAAVRNGL